MLEGEMLREVTRSQTITRSEGPSSSSCARRTLVKDGSDSTSELSKLSKAVTGGHYDASSACARNLVETPTATILSRIRRIERRDVVTWRTQTS